MTGAGPRDRSCTPDRSRAARHPGSWSTGPAGRGSVSFLDNRSASRLSSQVIFKSSIQVVRHSRGTGTHHGDGRARSQLANGEEAPGADRGWHLHRFRDSRFSGACWNLDEEPGCRAAGACRLSSRPGNPNSSHGLAQGSLLESVEQRARVVSGLQRSGHRLGDPQDKRSGRSQGDPGAGSHHAAMPGCRELKAECIQVSAGPATGCPASTGGAFHL
jgi:hypothetical protein